MANYHLAVSPVNLFDSFYQGHTNAKKATTDVGTFIGVILPNIIVAAGVVAFVYMVRNGFNLITQAGKNANPQDLAKARIAFSHSLIGFLLVVASYFILQIISVTTGVDFINPNVT